jgi:hypothetical protein
MNELERELSHVLGEPGAVAGDDDLAGRVRSSLERGIGARRNLAFAGAAMALLAAAAATVLIWKLGQAALTGLDTSRGTGVLLLLPVVAMVAIVGLAAWSVAGLMLRPRRW